MKIDVVQFLCFAAVVLGLSLLVKDVWIPARADSSGSLWIGVADRGGVGAVWFVQQGTEEFWFCLPIQSADVGPTCHEAKKFKAK